MPNVELIAALLVAVVPLVALAKRLNVAYPIVLILGGVAIGYVPGVPDIELQPDLVLVLFLPALVYWESITAPADEFRARWRAIAPLVLGLVAVTTLAVAAIAHAWIAGISWAAAIVFGAVVAPTDEIAFGPVAERLGVPRSVLAVVEGEALLNDATSLVIYSVALAALGGGAWTVWHIAGAFVYAAAGAIALGWAAAFIVTFVWSRLKMPQLQILVSILAPFLAFLRAQRLQVSGVLAVVTLGLLAARRTPLVIGPKARILATGFWESIGFVANAAIFLLVGLQMHPVLARLHGESWQRLALEALSVNASLALVRFAWMFAQYRGRNPRLIAIKAWAGMRGGVSLAAALALPRAMAHRDVFIFLTLTVLLATLVGQGLTLPAIVRWLNVRDDGAEEEDLQRARAEARRAALARLDEIDAGRAPSALARELRERYERGREEGDAYRELQIDIIEHQRDALVALHDNGRIDNRAMRAVQSTLDLELVRLRSSDEGAGMEDEAGSLSF